VSRFSLGFSKQAYQNDELLYRIKAALIYDDSFFTCILVLKLISKLLKVIIVIKVLRINT